VGRSKADILLDRWKPVKSGVIRVWWGSGQPCVIGRLNCLKLACG
jgi:hypothetical protein